MNKKKDSNKRDKEVSKVIKQSFDDILLELKFYRYLGFVIYEARKEKQITQLHLANMMNISRRKLSEVENGVRQPKLYEVLKLIHLIGIDYQDIIKYGIKLLEERDTKIRSKKNVNKNKQRR